MVSLKFRKRFGADTVCEMCDNYEIVEVENGTHLSFFRENSQHRFSLKENFCEMFEQLKFYTIMELFISLVSFKFYQQMGIELSYDLTQIPLKMCRITVKI